MDCQEHILMILLCFTIIFISGCIYPPLGIQNLPEEGLQYQGGDIVSDNSTFPVGQVIINYNSRNDTYVIREVVMWGNNSWKYPSFMHPEERDRRRLEKEMAFKRGKMDNKCVLEAYYKPMKFSYSYFSPHDDCYVYIPTF